MKNLPYQPAMARLIKFIGIKLTIGRKSISLRGHLKKVVQTYGLRRTQNRETLRYTKQRSRLQRQTCIPRPP